MQTIRINEDLVEIGGKARVERGPARKTGKATEALLADDKTAAHYQIGARDADGKVIESGKAMAYLDWLGERGFYVYALVDDAWLEDGFHDDEPAALARAATIASA
jgi:hypothetical protein